MYIGQSTNIHKRVKEHFYNADNRICEECGEPTDKQGRSKKCNKCDMKRVKGEGNPRAKLNREKVKQIRYLLSKGESIGSIAHKLNISESSVNDIRYFRTWKDVTID